jgi:hypothetical protein
MQMTQLTGHCPTQYEADEEALSDPQRDQIEHSAPKLHGGTIRSTLFEQAHVGLPGANRIAPVGFGMSRESPTAACLHPRPTVPQ